MSSNAPPAVMRETWLGHPKGLFLLFATEMWERFSYYGMRALLVLSLIAGVEASNPGFGWSQSEALKLYGLFTGFVYFTPLIGGWLADNYIGQRKSVIIGGVLMVLAAVLLSELTKAWLLYLGLIFLFMVMYAPGGIASLIMMNLRVASFGRLREIWVSYLALGVTALVILLGAGAMVEMIYHLKLDAAMGDELRYLGMTLHPSQVGSWFGSVFVPLTGLGVFELARRQFAAQWSAIQTDIEKEIKRRETE